MTGNGQKRTLNNERALMPDVLAMGTELKNIFCLKFPVNDGGISPGQAAIAVTWILHS